MLLEHCVLSIRALRVDMTLGEVMGHGRWYVTSPRTSQITCYKTIKHLRRRPRLDPSVRAHHPSCHFSRVVEEQS